MHYPGCKSDLTYIPVSFRILFITFHCVENMYSPVLVP